MSILETNLHTVRPIMVIFGFWDFLSKAVARTQHLSNSLQVIFIQKRFLKNE